MMVDEQARAQIYELIESKTNYKDIVASSEMGMSDMMMQDSAMDESAATQSQSATSQCHPQFNFMNQRFEQQI